MLPPSLLDPEQLTLKPGMVYSDQIRDKDIEALRKFYDDKFHLELGNFEGGIDPSSIDEKTGTADVKYNIYVARVAVVQITGNTRTKDKVIRRVLRVTPGMVVNTDWIKADYERLNATGYFSKVNPDIKDGPDPKKPQDVTLVWQVTEQRTARLRSASGTRAASPAKASTARSASKTRTCTAPATRRRFSSSKARARRRIRSRARFRISAIRPKVAEVLAEREHLLHEVDVLLSGVFGVRRIRSRRRRSSAGRRSRFP